MPALVEAGTQSSAEFATINVERLAEVTRRHQQLATFLEQEGYSALVLQHPANFSWLTAGGECCGGSAGHDPCAALFITPEARVVVTSNVDSPYLFEHQVPGLGFQLKERPWTEARGVLLADLCRGRRVASDLPLPGTTHVAHRLPNLRLPLLEYDRVLLRELGQQVTHAVEATCRQLTRGRTERDVAGEVSHRLLRHGVTPVKIQVLADGRRSRFRHWTYNDQTVNRFCSLVVVAKKQGLHVGVGRTVSFTPPTEETLTAFARSALVSAACLYFSQVDWDLAEVWAKVQRIYEKSGAVDEWRLADQGEVLEYESGSIPVMPTSQYRLTEGTPLFWHPSVGSIMTGESLMVTPRGAERLTLPSSGWPQVPVSVKGIEINIPGILLVEPESESIHS